MMRQIAAAANFKNITRADIDQNETESSCIHHFSCLSPLLGEMAENWT